MSYTISNAMPLPAHILWLAVVFLLVLTCVEAHGKTVNVCTEIKLPEKGKCIYKTVHGYKVRVCNK